jgi:hypothetical protein
MKKKAQSMAAEFADNLRAKIAVAPIPGDAIESAR